MTIEVNGNLYRLCLVDTNLLGGFFGKDPLPFQNLLRRIDASKTVIAISLFTVIELRRRSDIWAPFIVWLREFPTVLLKTTHMLLDDEIASYPDPSNVNPVLIAPFAIQPDTGQSKAEALSAIFENPKTRQLLDELSDGRQDILESILSHIPNYPIPQGRVPTEFATDFVEKLCFQQAAFHDLAWLEALGGAKADFDHNAFPSVKAAGYSAFFRFYTDKERKPKRSDPFDLANASVFPYVDMVATEADQAAIVRQRIAAVDSFLNHLQVVTMKDLRRSETK